MKVDILKAVDKIKEGGTMFEYLQGDPVVKLYFDYDEKTTREDPEYISRVKRTCLADLCKGLQVQEKDIVVASRHRNIDEKFKISFRFFVPSMKTNVSNIANIILTFLSEKWDIAPYKPSEQLLGCVMNHKSQIDVAEEVLKLESSHPIEDTIVQYTSEREILIDHVPLPEKLQAPCKPKQITDIDEIECLVKLLTPQRADDYYTWMKVGWCLHNIDECLLPQWEEFSKQSSKFCKGECERKWYNMRDEGLHLGSLHMWAKNDSPYQYKMYKNKCVFEEIKHCNGTHNAVASIAHKLLGKSYVCASPSGKLWYKFTGTLWKEDKEALNLRKELSSYVRDHFLIVMNKLAAPENDDTMSSASSGLRNNKDTCQRLLGISFKLQDKGFKDNIIMEMRDFMYQEEFLENLDCNPNLIAFTNGVWQLKEGVFRQAFPEDYLSLSVGYDYLPEKSEEINEKMKSYFHQLHPNEEQYNYVLNTLARQLYGDNGFELFHVHSGHKGSAGNGKSRFFEVLEIALGQYVRKFPVELLVSKQRGEAHKPIPEYKNWKGRRILYCSEPNREDKLHSGIMKEFTGGEPIHYRLLFSNDIHKFHPQYKMHIMCNDTPQVDAADKGVKRRIRKIDYRAQFVDEAQVDESKFKYKKDMGFIEAFKTDNAYKMEFLRLLLDTYRHKFTYEMPNVVKMSSEAYLEENNHLSAFVAKYIQYEEGDYFALKDVKECIKGMEIEKIRMDTLKRDLEKVLDTTCLDQKTIRGYKYKNIFYNFKLTWCEF